jgi:carbamoyl-phosphate synthase large subunit
MAIVTTSTRSTLHDQRGDASPSTRPRRQVFEDAFEFDVDAIADATGAVVIGGIMEHIEEVAFTRATAPWSRRSSVLSVTSRPSATTRAVARVLRVIGL